MNKQFTWDDREYLIDDAIIQADEWSQCCGEFVKSIEENQLVQAVANLGKAKALKDQSQKWYKEALHMGWHQSDNEYQYDKYKRIAISYDKAIKAVDECERVIYSLGGDLI